MMLLFHITVTVLSVLVSATPVELVDVDTLPNGFESITREEILVHLGNSSSSTLQKRTPGGIYLCTGENWTGTCGYKVQPVCANGCETQAEINAACVTLTSPWYHGIGSFGPDAGAMVYMSSNGGCVEADASLAYPGTSDFKDYAGGEGTKITSFYATTIYSGEGTYYGQYGATGSCGHVYPDSAFIIALSDYWQDYGYKTPWCGRKVKITNTASGTSGYGLSTTATVADTCAGCAQTHIDMSKGLFSYLTNGDYDEGVFSVNWNFCNINGQC